MARMGGSVYYTRKRKTINYPIEATSFNACENARNTIEFFGILKSLHDPTFKPLEFEGIRNETGHTIPAFEWRLQ